MIDGTRVGDGADVGVERIDVNRDANHHDSIVIGTRQGRRHCDHAQRGSLERARQEHLADRVEWMGARAGCDVGGTDLAAGGAARAGLLGPTRVLGSGRDRALRAVAEAAEARRQPRRHPEIEVAKELIAVFATQLQPEVGEVAGDRVRGPGDEAGVERALLAGTGPAVGTSVDRDDRVGDLRGERRIPWREYRFGAVDPALRGGGHQRPIGCEEVEVELVERHLGQVVDAHRHPTGPGIGMDGRDELRVHAEALGHHDDAVLVAGLRFADVEGPGQRAGKGRGMQFEGPDLRVVRTVRGFVAVEVRLSVGAGNLAIRRIGVDGQAFGQRDRRRSKLGRRVRLSQEDRIPELHVEAGGRIRLGVRQRQVEHGVEDLFLAAGRRRIARLRLRGAARVLVAGHLEVCGQRLPGANRRVVDEGLDGDPGSHVWRHDAARAGETGAAALADMEPVGVMFRIGREAPYRDVGAGKGNFLGDPAHGHPQSVVGAGADRDRNVDRHVRRRRDEGETSCLEAPAGLHVVERSGPEQVVRVRFVVRVDRDDAHLRGTGALIQREVHRAADGDRLRVPEQALGEVDRHILRGLGFTRIVHRDRRRHVRVGARLGVR